MSTPTFPEPGGCGRPASARIEVYAPAGGQAFGSLVAVAYACGEHVRPFLTALDGAGLAGHVDPDPTAARDMGRPCGHVFHYDRPAVQGPAVTAVPEGTSPTQEHPEWCALVTDDGPCADVEYHSSAWITVDSVENDAPGIEVQLTTAGGLAVVIRYLYEDEVTVQILPLEQAATLAGVLSGLVTRAGAQ